MGTMRPGDANNDNLVELVDFNILVMAFGVQPGDPGYDARADFDRSTIVDIYDYTLLKRNFGQLGAGLSGP